MKLKATMIFVIALACNNAGAFELPPSKTVSLAQFVKSPQSYRDQTVRLRQFGCVDDHSFVCMVIHDGRIIRVKATGLGAGPAQEIAEDMIGGCSGTANIQRPKCQFDIIIRPMSIIPQLLKNDEGSIPVIDVYSMEIEFIRSKAER